MKATVQRFVLSIALAIATGLSMQDAALARQASAASVAPVRAKPLVLAIATSVDIADVTITHAASGLIQQAAVVHSGGHASERYPAHHFHMAGG